MTCSVVINIDRKTPGSSRLFVALPQRQKRENTGCLVRKLL